MSYFKKYFENIIDWKSFNYLLSILTPYEDTGAVVTLYVCVTDVNNPEKLDDIYGIYYYSTIRQNGLYCMEDSSYLIDCYEKFPKFYYKLGFKIENELSNYKNELDEICNKIKNRFNINRADNIIVVDKKDN